MSASQEKKKRWEERTGGADKRSVSEQQAEKEKRKNRILTIAVGALIVLLLVFAVTVNSNLLYRTGAAVTIDGVGYNAAEFNFFYFSGYMNFVNANSDYISWYGLDTSKPLDTQECLLSEDYETWEDYFNAMALDSMKNITMLCKEAQAAGFETSEEGYADIEEAAASVKEAAELYGYAGADQYLAASYGKGLTLEMLRGLWEKTTLASEFAVFKQNSFEYTDEELEAYYEENRDSYDIIEYRSYTVTAETDQTEYAEGEEPSEEEAAEITAGFMAEAKVIADEIYAASKSEQEYIDAVAAQNPESTAEEYAESTHRSAKGSSLYGDSAEWLLSNDRREGDTEVIETASGYEILYFLSRDDNHYATKKARHILIKTEDPDYEFVEGDEEYDEAFYTSLLAAARTTALAEAERILGEWKKGDATEESFAELANEFSQDDGSNTAGGLYENIYQGQMVSEFDAFCFDPERKPGDTGVIFGESSYYSGYHVMYFVGDGALYSSYLAETDMRNGDYSAWETERIEALTVKTGFTMRFTK